MTKGHFIQWRRNYVSVIGALLINQIAMWSCKKKKKDLFPTSHQDSKTPWKVTIMFPSLVLNWVLPMASITQGLRMEKVREFTPQPPSQTIFMNCLIPMSPQFYQAACHEPGKGVPLDGRRNKVLGRLALRHWVTPQCFINTAHASVSRPVTRFSKDLVCFQRELWLNGALPIYDIDMQILPPRNPPLHEQLGHKHGQLSQQGLKFMLLPTRKESMENQFSR